MPGIYELATRFVSPYYFPFVVGIVVIIFSVAAYYIYTNYIGNTKKIPVTQLSDDDKSSDGKSADDRESKKSSSFNLLDWINDKIWKGDQKYRDDNQKVVRPGEKITVYFFTADWCPHCRKAKPTIDDFEHKYNGQSLNGRTIAVERVDCTDSEITEVAEKINHFDVTSFPTVKIQDSKKNVFDFDAKITNENLDNFVNTVANN